MIACEKIDVENTNSLSGVEMATFLFWFLLHSWGSVICSTYAASFSHLQENVDRFNRPVGLTASLIKPGAAHC